MTLDDLRQQSKQQGLKLIPMLMELDAGDLINLLNAVLSARSDFDLDSLDDLALTVFTARLAVLKMKHEEEE